MTALSDRDAVRLNVGDTDTGSALLTDNEIDHFLLQRTFEGTVNVLAAAADAAMAIAASFARDYNFSEDGQSFSKGDLISHYMQLSASLRQRARSATLTSYPVTTMLTDETRA